MDGSDDLEKRAAKATLGFVVALAIMIFLAAGSLSYWQGWLFLIHFSAWCAGLTYYFLKHDPALIERRLRVGPAAERESSQKRIQLFTSIVTIALFIGSVLDYRFGFSVVPVPMVVLGHVLIAAGFLACYFVFRENSYASATVEVREGQRVVSSGPYGLVRHPMYAGVLPLFLGIPLALGSYWLLIGILFVLVGLVARLLDEERHLSANLPGYGEYCRKVRYRLLPGIW
ncbi:MAG: isoprenylcysteine carboxylmethyltransferase family protein [Shinella sp.]|nr:isoprenylcysteine carboxylmethyltransferase family protein [Shinella sp.]